MNRPGTTPRGLLALVVDDDPTMRLMLESTLARSGLRTVFLGNAHAAQAAFEAETPDVVLLDIGLPDVDGCTLCSTLRALPGGRDVPIIMLTGHDDAASVGRAYESGCDRLHRQAHQLGNPGAPRPLHPAFGACLLRRGIEPQSHGRCTARGRTGQLAFDAEHDELQCSVEARRILGHGGAEDVATFAAFFRGHGRR